MTQKCKASLLFGFMCYAVALRAILNMKRDRVERDLEEIRFAARAAPAFGRASSARFRLIANYFGDCLL